MYYRAFLQRRWHAAAAGAVLGIVGSCLEAIGGGSCNKKTVPQRRIAFERREQIYSCCTRGTTLIVADATSLHDQRVCVKQANGESLLRDNGQVPAMPTAGNAINTAAPGPVTLYLPHRLAPTDGSLQRSGYGFLPIFAFELMRLF